MPNDVSTSVLSVKVMLDQGEPCVTAVKTHHTLWCCVSMVPRPTTSPPAISSRQRSTGCSRRWSARRAEPRNTRPTTTPSSCGATTMGSPSPSYQSVFFFCVTSLAVLSSWSAVGVKADALVALFLYCSFHGVCVVGFSVANRQFDCGCCAETATSLATVPEAIERCRCCWCTLSSQFLCRRSRSRVLLARSPPRSMRRSCGFLRFLNVLATARKDVRHLTVQATARVV